MSHPSAPQSANAEQVLIDRLRERGFVDAGLTATETVRIGTVTTPIYGGSGGKLVTSGGRRRLTLPGTDLRVTVGPRSTCLYRVVGSAITDMNTLATKEADRILLTITELLLEVQPSGPQP